MTKSTTPPPPPFADDVPVNRDSLRGVREAERPPRASAPRRSSTSSPALEAAVAELHVARAAALGQFATGAAAIATGLREYQRAWAEAVRASRHVGDDNDGSGSHAALGGPLRPQTSELHPKKLKAALARTLSAAGVDLLDSSTRLGGRKRGRR